MLLSLLDQKISPKKNNYILSYKGINNDTNRWVSGESTIEEKEFKSFLIKVCLNLNIFNKLRGKLCLLNFNFLSIPKVVYSVWLHTLQSVSDSVLNPTIYKFYTSDYMQQKFGFLHNYRFNGLLCLYITSFNSNFRLILSQISVIK